MFFETQLHRTRPSPALHLRLPFGKANADGGCVVSRYLRCSRQQIACPLPPPSPKSSCPRFCFVFGYRLLIILGGCCIDHYTICPPVVVESAGVVTLRLGLINFTRLFTRGKGARPY